MSAPFQSSRMQGGFTLLEMVITMAIFLLLAGAVFGIVTGVLQGASTLHDNQNRRDQIAALNAYLKKNLGDLPAQSMLVSYRRGDGEGLAQNGIVLGGNSGLTVIDATPQANGYYTLRSGIINIIGPGFGSGPSSFVAMLPEFLVSKDDPSFNWIPLIRDIKTLHWKFQDSNTTLWSDQWNNANAKPNIVEFSMQLAGDAQPVAMDFWLPQIVPVSMAIPAQSGMPTQPANGSQSAAPPQPITVPPPHVLP